MTKRTVFVMLDCSMSDDDVWNNAREAVARMGFQVADLAIVARNSMTDLECTLETTAPAGITCSWHGVQVQTALSDDEVTTWPMS